MNNDSETLNQRFALPGSLTFKDSAPGFPVAEISTPGASARVAVQGGQVLAWQPEGQAPVIWTSRAAVYQPGKGVRGGAPVCWPWFGGREGLGAHGFVRTRMWRVRETRLDSSQQVVLRLGIGDDPATRKIWDHAFDLELIVTVGSTLQMELVTRNTGDTPFCISEGFHTYFRVGDIERTTIAGLDNCEYLDKASNAAGLKQQGPVSFSGETDRVYLNSAATCSIDDPVLRRSIRVAKGNSASTVVWNPWSEKEKTFADMATGEYTEMLCLETVNVGPVEITVAPGARHSLAASISVA